MTYEPKPIDTKGVTLPAEIEALIEELAASNHDNWALLKIAKGYKYGPVTSDADKMHADLIDYSELTDEKKEYDRVTSRESIKMLYALGFKIVKALA